MVITAKITSKGQITLPKKVRNFLNVEEGEVIVFEKAGTKVLIKPVKTLKEFKGILKNRKKGETFDSIRKIAKRDVAKRRMSQSENK